MRTTSSSSPSLSRNYLLDKSNSLCVTFDCHFLWHRWNIKMIIHLLQTHLLAIPLVPEKKMKKKKPYWSWPSFGTASGRGEVVGQVLDCEQGKKARRSATKRSNTRGNVGVQLSGRGRDSWPNHAIPLANSSDPLRFSCTFPSFSGSWNAREMWTPSHKVYKTRVGAGYIAVSVRHPRRLGIQGADVPRLIKNKRNQKLETKRNCAT